ncbi:sugar ABC transporter substrate-binding protein [Nocardioides sp.]|uniref:sugar ABC transporter substrate-binding protein n=1 Tax=Nocardioides sp. TaxID=35761 RepID=UPI0039E63888
MTVKSAHRRTSRLAPLALLAAGALALTACSGSSASDTTTGATSDTGAAATSADATGGAVPAGVTEVVEQATAKVTEFPGPTEAVAAPEGKRVMIIVCGSIGIGCVLGADGAKDAAEALGWEATITDGKLDPTVQNSLIKQAVTDGYDGVVLTSMNPALVAGGLADAKEAGIPVVSVYIPHYDGAPEVDGYVTSDHTEGGKIAADWMIADSQGAANVLVLDDPAYPETTERNDAMVDEFEANCPGCTVKRQEFSAASMAQQLASQVSASLGQDDELDYVWAPYDAAGPFVQQGIQQAGKTKAVKFVSAEGDPTAADAVRGGTQAADLVTADDYMGWVSIDLLARTFAGVEHDAQATVPQRLLTADNISDVPSGDTWSLDGVDYAAAFKKLWGK